MTCGERGGRAHLRELLDPVRIAQRVERVLSTARAGRDGGDHGCLGAANKRVAQHLREVRVRVGVRIGVRVRIRVRV